MAVASLQSMGHLNDMATILDNTFNGNIYAINIIIGLLSAIVDNVPLVAWEQWECMKLEQVFMQWMVYFGNS